MGRNNIIFLPPELIQRLQTRGYLTLYQIPYQINRDIQKQGWKGSFILGLEGEHADTWDIFIAELKRGHIHIKDVPDEVVCIKNKTVRLQSVHRPTSIQFDDGDDKHRRWCGGGTISRM